MGHSQCASYDIMSHNGESELHNLNEVGLAIYYAAFEN